MSFHAAFRGTSRACDHALVPAVLRTRKLPPRHSCPASSEDGRSPAQPASAAIPPSPTLVNAAVLKEYGFDNFESATYVRDDGRKLALKAARFADTSGAYGAFTFYKTPPMLVEKIGDQAGSLNERVLFYRGNILIDAVFQRLSAMSAAELRELAAGLLWLRAALRGCPGCPPTCHAQAYVKNSARYVLGPTTLERVGAPIPSQLVDFSAGAEIVLGKIRQLRRRSDLGADLLSHAANRRRSFAENRGSAIPESARHDLLQTHRADRDCGERGALAE